MINKLCIFITDCIPGVDDVKKRIYVYCLEYMISQAIYVSIILLYGVMTGRFRESMILLITIIPLRAYAGGAHASSKLGCTVISYGMSIFCISIIPVIIKYFAVFHLIILFISCAVIVWRISPVVHMNKQLSLENKKRLHKKCGFFVLFISGLSILFVFIGDKKAFTTISMCVAIVCVSSIVGHIQNREGNRYGIKNGNM